MDATRAAAAADAVGAKQLSPFKLAPAAILSLEYASLIDGTLPTVGPIDADKEDNSVDLSIRPRVYLSRLCADAGSSVCIVRCDGMGTGIASTLNTAADVATLHP